TITGKVTGAGGTPLNGVTVYIGGRDVDYGNYFTTNALGVYTATGLPTGHYFVLFRPSNLIEEAYNNKQFDAENYDLVSVTAATTTAGIDAVLEEGASISGKVTAADGGAPIKGIFVEVLDPEGRRVETAFTQADGTYQTPPKLRQGQYKVIFNADERNATCAYVTEYYNDKTTVETADLITVNGPGALTNIDAVLTRGSILFGRVTDEATGAPITSGQVSIFNEQGKHVGFGRLTFLGGWYSSTALPSGSYRLLFRDYDGGYIDEYYDNKLTLEEATPVNVTAPNDVTLLNAALAKGGTISGRVTTGDTGQPFRYGYVTVYDLAGNEVASAGIEDDGTYTVNDGLATGSYNVLVVPYDSQSEASVLGLAEVQGVSPGSEQPGYAPTFFGNLITPKQATPVAVTAPNNTPNIDIVMQRGVWLPLIVH
ncbi:MAG TPA: carboxypeptidase-like regulatory domain-containing protein, partial [Roseiflexaceae bacterium]|nr:carboxypeptidase-like regulatory domain-containing protein [Roseiflexaceae bacterium]